MLCYSNGRKRSNHKGHFGYVAPRAETWGDYMSWLRRASGTGVEGGAGVLLDDAKFLKDFPALLELVSATSWEDGKSRKTSTMLLFVEEGRWKCCLSDREQQLTAFLSAGTHQGLLQAAEKGLQGGTVEWRKQKPYTPSRK